MIYESIFKEKALTVSEAKDFALLIEKSDPEEILFTLYDYKRLTLDYKSKLDYNVDKFESNIKELNGFDFELLFDKPTRNSFNSDLFKKCFYDSIIAMIRLNVKSYYKIPKLAYSVGNSASKENSKAGVLMYDIALSYLKKYKKGLVPDRKAVSPFAQKVWKYYFNNRNDVIKIPIDDYYNPVTKLKSDDGMLYGQEGALDEIETSNEYNNRSYIDHIYIIKNPIDFSNLIDNHNLFVSKDFIDSKRINDLMYSVSISFFSDRYRSER